MFDLLTIEYGCEIMEAMNVREFVSGHATVRNLNEAWFVCDIAVSRVLCAFLL